MTDLVDRLRAADPVPEAPVPPPVEWMLARLEDAAGLSPGAPAGSPDGAAPSSAPHCAAPPHDRAALPRERFAPRAPSPRRRARRRLRVVVPVFAAALAVALVVLLGRGSSPDVIAEAKAALGTPGEIVHTVTRTEQFDQTGKLLGPGHYAKKGEMSDRMEQWAALNPLRTRTRMTILPPGGGVPLHLDYDYVGGVSRSAPSWSKTLRIFPLPAGLVADYEADNSGSATALDAGADPVAGIRALLSAGVLKPAGESEVDGRRVLRLRGERPRRNLPGSRAIQLAVKVEYLVDAETYAPVQVIYHVTHALGLGGAQTTRRTFVTYERLPLAGNEALLRIADAEQRRVLKNP